MTRYCMVIDQRRCIGCHSCTIACKVWNKLPTDIIYNPVITEGAQGTWPNVHRVYTPTLCMHCDKPPCVPCCPSGASQRDDDGTVWVDPQKCLSCKVCVNACPYGMRDASEVEFFTHRFVRKCTFCRDKRQLDPDAQPYCVLTCHQKARIFGDLDDPDSEVSQLVGNVKTERLFEDFGTEPQIYYIPDLGGRR